MKTGRGAAAVFTKAMSLAALFACAQQAGAAPRVFSIPAGPANQTLTQFARQAGLPLALPYELTADRRTPRVRGRMEPDEALRRLLRGTGLVAERDANGQFLIRRAAPAAATLAPVAGEAVAPGAPLVEELHEVQVTGSRIDRNGMGTPTPVTVLSAEELEGLSPLSLAEALAELPHFLNNDTPQSQSFATSTAAGASYMNLRGIGSIRTLTLVDGRRVVPATRFGTVDYALLPKALLRKVEVVTGGASAAYGSDAVSGVVNLQLDTGFEGFRLRGQGGLSELGDNGNVGASLVWGTRVGEDSHFVVSAEFNTAEGIRGYRDRPWFRSWATIIDPAPAGGPPLVLVPDVKASNFTFGGLVTSGPLAGTQFLPGGVPAPFDRGRYYTSNSHSGGDGVDLAADMIWMLPDQRRGNLLAKFDTTIAPGFTAFAQLLAGHSRSTFEKDPPALWGQWEATIFADNAFLPGGIRQQMQAQGIASFRLGRSSSGDLGAGRVDNIGNLLSVTLGAARDMGDWNVEGYYQFGQNHSLLRYTEALRVDRVYRGVDSVLDPSSGRIVCRSTLSFPDDGCIPVNLFGEGSISPAAREWITEGIQEQSQHVSEHVAEVMLQGSLFDLPAGRVKLATGINWRREAVDNTPRRFPAGLEGLTVAPAATQGYRGLPSAYSGAGNIFERTVVNSVSGHYDVWELFGETALPLVRELPLVQDLTLHAAVRYAHYSGSGDVPAWKGGLDWTLDDNLRLRVTRSRDVRAGSLSERFDTNGGGATIFDPQATAAPFFYAINSFRTGNPQVEPEQADTWTGGLVLTPRAVPGLSVSADYYDIRIRDAIGLLGAQNIINRCNNGQEYYCTLVTRSATSGQIVRVSNLILNLTEARSRGIDAEVEWRHPVTLFGGGESMALRIFGNRMLESSVTGISGVKLDRQDQTGQVGGSPRWQANLSLAYWRDALHLTVQQRFISPGRFSASYQPTTIVSNRVAGASYTNLRAAWSWGGASGLTLFAQVNNLFDRNPPRAADFGFAGTVPTNETLFDVIGRRFVVGFSYDR